MKTEDKVNGCRRVEKNIALYLNNELNDDEFLNFYSHILNCKSCKEELTIQYLVKVGLEEIDTLQNLDLLHGLDKKMEDKFNRIVLKKSVRFGMILCGIGLALFAIFSFIF